MLPRLLLFALCGATVANGQVNTKKYNEDSALVTHFMNTNGGYIIKYRKVEEIFWGAIEILRTENNLAARAEATEQGTKARAIMKDCKSKMVDIHISPEEWTEDDLVKLKNDPKGAEVFKALVRVRNAIYDPAVPADVRKQLAKNLLTAMGEGTATSELRGLLDRVQTVGGGRPSN